MQVAGYARMSPTQKHRVFVRMLNACLSLKKHALAQQHPDWPESEVRRQLARFVRDGRT